MKYLQDLYTLHAISLQQPMVDSHQPHGGKSKGEDKPDATEGTPLLLDSDNNGAPAKTTTNRSFNAIIVVPLLLLILLLLLVIVAHCSNMQPLGGGGTIISTLETVMSGGSGSSSTTVVKHMVQNSNLQCTVEQCTDMLYTNGADASIDRPSHLRAASSMQWISNSRLVIVQDDSNFVAVVEVDRQQHDGNGDPSLKITEAYSIALPSNEGHRQFQKSKGNKKLKLDLEASIYVPKQHSPLDEGFFLAFGSGSADYRNVIILIKDSLLSTTSQKDVNVGFRPVNGTYWEEYCGGTQEFGDDTSPLVAFYAPSLYEMFRKRTDFSGSELNVEGAEFNGDDKPAKIRLFQRGNGAPSRDLTPKNAIGEMLAEELFQYMDSLLVLDGQEPLFYKNKKGASDLPPELVGVQEYDLGTVQGVKLTFTGSTGVTLSSAGFLDQTDVVYISGAEDSPDATRDGEVVGTALGLVFSDRHAFQLHEPHGAYNFLTYPNGTKFLHKTEGITISPQIHDGDEEDVFALTVLDMDDPGVPSQMCLVRIRYEMQ